MNSLARAFTAIGASLALAGLTGCSSDAPSTTVSSDAPASATDSSITIGLTYIPNVQFSPVYVAHDDGLYSSEGLDVTVRHHGSDEGLFTALISGEENVVIASGDEALIARDSGHDLISIGAYYQSFPGVVIVPADSQINSLEDLKGANIGIPGEYGSTWYTILAALDQGGLNAEDVTISSIGYTQQAALAQGHVDAVVGFTNNDLVQMQLAGVPVRAISLDASTPLVAGSIITTRQWAQANPEQARAVVAATTAGIQSVVDDNEHALAIAKTWDDTLTDETQLDRARKVLAATSTLFLNSEGGVSAVQDIDKWTRMGDFLATIPGLVTQAPDGAHAMTNDYTEGR